MKSISKPVKLIIAIVVAQSAGIIGSFFTTPAIQGWYKAAEKPAITPPNWIFAPVWTLLFLLMGVALYLVWISHGKQKKTAYTVFFFQLLVNIFWSTFFFYLKAPILAFIDITILWLLILINIMLFYRISKWAGYLLIPYLLWVSFATALNYAFISLV